MGDIRKDHYHNLKSENVIELKIIFNSMLELIPLVLFHGTVSIYAHEVGGTEIEPQIGAECCNSFALQNQL